MATIQQISALHTVKDPVTAYNLAMEGVTVERHYCRRGEDYDCRCLYCSNASFTIAKRQAETVNQQTASQRAEIAQISLSFQWLCRLGQAVEAALSPGVAVSCMIHDCTGLRESARGEIRGFNFRVVGRRGTAKAHYGKIGTCKWFNTDEYGKISRVGLQIQGEDKLAYCAFTQLERVPMSADVLHADAVARTETILVKEAIAPHRPKLVVTLKRRGSKPIAYVVSGREAGKHGEVFWIGTDKRTGEADARFGIRTAIGEVVWVSAYDCATQPVVEVSKTERAEIERVAADMVLEGKVERAKEILLLTRTPLK